MIEAKVNDVVTINDKHYKVVEEDYNCLGCAGISNNSLCCDFHDYYGMCSSSNRMDGKSIIYLEVK